MISEIELLKEDIPILEKRFGASNPFVAVLKAQLAALQNPAAYECQQRQLNLGFLAMIKSLFSKL